jgi:hypothetical protein
VVGLVYLRKRIFDAAFCGWMSVGARATRQPEDSADLRGRPWTVAAARPSDRIELVGKSILKIIERLKLSSRRKGLEVTKLGCI